MVKTRIDRICDALEREYGQQRWTRHGTILDELIYTILSQNTSAANCERAFRALIERFPTWDHVRLASQEEIADAIRVGGLADQKAPRIKRILKGIHNRKSNLDLEWLANLADEEALAYLSTFDGVGRKTAACVLMFGLGRPVMPVDTHVHRVATRLGLIEKTTADRAHDLLQALVPPERIYSCHLNLVAHGRRVCRARQPRCNQCVLRAECDHLDRGSKEKADDGRNSGPRRRPGGGVSGVG
ncbi:MAG: endonuclease III domain-containing protein [Armatimonadota bacterium]